MYFKICLVITIMTVFLFSCQKAVDKPAADEISTSLTTERNGVTQLSGIGYWDEADACNAAGQGADLAFTFTGDLQGCWYVFIDEFKCSPSGTYREVGRELFVGTYNGEPGTFWTTYKFEARYEDCDGGPLGAEIFGRCQHPITSGSGTGVFEGVTGRVDMKDDIEAGNYPYRGHLQF